MKMHAVATYLLRGDSVLLLIRNKKNDTVHRQGVYLPVGGKVEKSESIETAAKREVKEESGIVVNSLQLKAVVHGRSTTSDWVHFIFFSHNFSGEPVDGNEGSFIWVPINQIHTAPMYEGDCRVFQDCLKHNFIVVDRLTDDLILKDYSLLYAA